MVVVFVVLLLLTLWGLSLYTRHGHSVDVPDLKGLQVEEAAAILGSVGLGYEVIDSLYEKKGVPGAVLDQVQKPNSKVKSGRVVYLVIQAKSKEMVAMPDVEDNSYRQAESLLASLGFKNIKKETVPSQYRDLVFSVTYKGKVVKPGEKVPLDAVLTLKVGAGSGVEEVEERVSEPDYPDIIEETTE
jgi:beta-lactam-binding protein with PASTA domain